MTMYQLSNYLLVCERDPFTGFGGCGTELLLEQKRSMTDASAAAAEQGWLANPPGPWDETRDWFALCPYCGSQRQAQLAAYEAKRADAGSGG